MLVLPNREAWQFTASPGDAFVEDSIFLATPDGMRRTEQIVLALRPNETPRCAGVSNAWPAASTPSPRAEPEPELL